MRTVCQLFLTAFLLPLAPLLLAGEEEARLERMIEVGRNDNRALDHLDVLCNRFGPRLTGSDNLQNACEWAEKKFASFGLDHVRLEEAGEFPVGFNRGPWWGAMVEPVEKVLHFGTDSWSAGTRGVVRAAAILAPKDEEELKALGEKLAGRWVFFQTPRRTSRGNFRRIQGLSRAIENAGVAGIITASRGDLILTSGRSPRSWAELPTVPRIRLVSAEWQEIAGRLEKGENVVLEFDIRNHFKPGPVKYYNVIADIPGTERPEEVVIIGGHLDSWDGATGTVDNGTGCATTLEAARLLMEAGVQPRRTIRFMLWTGEEQGLLGSRAYVKNHPDLLEKISAVIVHDGGTNYLSGISATEAMRVDLEKAFARVVDLHPDMPFKVRQVVGLPVGMGSDHDSFLRAGVPGFFWGQSGKADYRRAHHTQFDTFNEVIPEYLEHSSLVVALGALGIANLDHLLSREKMTAPRRRMMGVQLDGLTIVAVIPGSAAEKAGCKAGDVILELEDKKLRSRIDLQQVLGREGNRKRVLLQRGDEQLERTLIWEETRARSRQKRL